MPELSWCNKDLKYFFSIPGDLWDRHIECASCLLHHKENTRVVFGLPLFLFPQLYVCILKSRLVKAVSKSKHICLVGKIYTSIVECQLEVFL